MASLGETCRDKWLQGSSADFGEFVDRLRCMYPATFRTQSDILALLHNVLIKAGMPEGKLPTLADLDARLYDYEHKME